jgi:hypothetical protein
MGLFSDLVAKITSIIRANKTKIMEMIDSEEPTLGYIDIKKGEMVVEYIGHISIVHRDDYTTPYVAFRITASPQLKQFYGQKHDIPNPLQCVALPTAEDALYCFHQSAKQNKQVCEVIISPYGITIIRPNDLFTKQIPAWHSVYTRSVSVGTFKEIVNTIARVNLMLYHTFGPTQHLALYHHAFSIETKQGLHVQCFKW